MTFVNKYIHHDNKNLYDFEIVIEDSFYNANRIHPLKQHDTLTFIQQASLDSNIKGIIVFGSAVRFDCNSYSDLDILIIRDDDKLTIENGALDQVNSELDIIFSSKLGPRLAEEIANTGVIVYEKEGSYV